MHVLKFGSTDELLRAAVLKRLVHARAAHRRVDMAGASATRTGLAEVVLTWVNVGIANSVALQRTEGLGRVTAWVDRVRLSSADFVTLLTYIRQKD